MEELKDVLAGCVSEEGDWCKLMSDADLDGDNQVYSSVDFF
jgi:hypothetical protein